MTASKQAKQNQNQVPSNQITPGMIISIGKQLCLIESAVKVTVSKGTPFIKTKLRNLGTNKISEKNFKADQSVTEAHLEQCSLEFMYVDGKEYLFLDINSLETVSIPHTIVGDAVNFLKEGIQLTASLYSDQVFGVELPQFLELMIASTADGKDSSVPAASATRRAVLETGAKLEVPPFIEAGDIIKVDTKTSEYIQRV